MNRSSKIDLRALTGLRGIAAWFVLFYHIRTGMVEYLPSQAIDVLAKGYLAVDLFFILSGFVMYLTYADRFQTLTLSFYKNFIWRRIARIWPLHIFMIGICCAFVALLIVSGRADHEAYPLSELPLHIILIQNWGFTHNLSWNHPAWSISAELFAYLLFPFIASYIALHRWSSFMLIIGIISLSAIISLYFYTLGYNQLGQNIAQTGLVRCLIEFIMGMIICILWKRGKEKPAQIAILASATSLLFFILFLSGYLYETFAIPLALAAFLLANALIAGHPKNPLGNRIFHYLGEISYATYLVHFIFYIFFKIIFVDNPDNVAPLLVAVYCIMILCASSLLYHGLEKPAQKWMNKRFIADSR